MNYRFIHVFTNSHHRPRPHGHSFRSDNKLRFHSCILIVTTTPVLMVIPFEAIINHASIHVFANSHPPPPPPSSWLTGRKTPTYLPVLMVMGLGPSLRSHNELLYSPIVTTTPVLMALPFEAIMNYSIHQQPPAPPSPWPFPSPSLRGE